MAVSPLGTNLRTAREAAGWSRAGLADASGTSEPAIAKTELYGSKPRLATIEAWAKALGVPIAALLSTDEDRIEFAMSRGACPNCTTATVTTFHHGPCPFEAVAS
jgi:transcriptional regulator with XRE-family HTH domain